MHRIACVAVEIVYAADMAYRYRIPAGMEGQIGAGCLVRVPFGKSNRKASALVLSVTEDTQDELKEIHSVTGEKLSPQELALVEYLKDRYFCSYFDALKLVYPAAGKKQGTPLYERYLRLTGTALPAKLSEKQRRVVEYLQKNGVSPVQPVLLEAAVSTSVLTTLEKHGIVETVLQQKNRSPIVRKSCQGEKPGNALNGEQKKAFAEIAKDLGSGKTRLLYGVTGSGKTHVFIALIDAVLKENKSALLLIPEISLTFQVIERFYSHYGNRLAVIHSGLSAGEKADEWERIKNGRADVVVGTRSAVFAPLRALGTIIIDEEQEHTYKSEMSPRYHAREVAAFRVVQEKALLLLASATPSYESFYKARTGVIGYSELLSRYNGNPLPKAVTVDLQQEVFSGNDSVISRYLAVEIEKNLKQKEQTILFMNRRGYNSYVACPKCRNVLKCPNCGIPLTFHLEGQKLLCHYCGHTAPARTGCAACGSETMRYTGVGTQKAQEQLLRLFPGIRILRMDADTVTAKHSRDEILAAFAGGEYDVLLGTQMITKGLDFPNVTLVGVLNADSMLYSSDFRAYERTFSLVTQVIGRAGRAEKSGRAVVQTFSPSHEVLQYAFRQDYQGFYENQIPLRRSLLYPPYCDVCQAVFVGGSEARAIAAADRFVALVKQLLEREENNAVGVKIIKPRITFVPMVDGKSRSRILIKCKDNQKTRRVLQSALLAFIREKENKDVSASIDMNPMNIL